MKENHENKARENDRETKDARGGNHNPEGANQYTTGRVDDRGRKAEPEAYQVLENQATNGPETDQEPPELQKPHQVNRDLENR